MARRITQDPEQPVEFQDNANPKRNRTNSIQTEKKNILSIDIASWGNLSSDFID
jgi:hypothetical protein